MKGVQLLIESKLPEDIRDYNRKYDKKGLAQLMLQIAERHPDKYAELSKFIGDVGRKAAYTQGETVRWSDLQPVVDKRTIFADMDARLDAIDTMGMSDADRTKARLQIMAETSNRLKQETMDNALARGNSLAISVISGARGNPDQLKTMLTSPALYMDQKGEPIPFFIRNSFTEGVRPAEYLAGMFGARQAITTMKRATAVGGDFCLAEGTLVRMADGTTRQIQDIQVGDWVLGADINSNTFPVRVVQTFDQGVKTTYGYRIFNSGNTSLYAEERCTRSHKFLNHDYRRRKNQIRVTEIGDLNTRYAKLVKQRERTDSTGEHCKEALLLGLLTGDGNVPEAGKKKIGFTCFDSELIDDVRGYIESLGVRLHQRKTNPNQYTLTCPGCYRSPLKKMLAKYGYTGKRSYQKDIPAGIWGWDKVSVCAYLAGYFATDGCVTHKTAGGKVYGYISMSTSSRHLAYGIKALCKHFLGIDGAEVHETPVEDIKATFEANHPSFMWSISSAREIEVFLQNVNIPGVKKHRAADLKTFAGTIKNGSQGRLNFAEAPGSKKKVRCHDIEVDHPDHLFVLASGVICSNSKQLQASASHLTVTMDDCGTTNGIMVDSAGPEIRGRVLMQDAGGVPSNTFLDRELSRQVRAGKGGAVRVRSPITCQAPEGICAKCAGATPEGVLPSIGDSVGITAGQALGEPICLDRDTLVRMADGSVKKICDIKAGEYVMGSDMVGNLTPTRVLEVHHNGIRDCCETSVRKGKGGKSEQAKLISTYEHKALVGKGRLSSTAKPVIAPVEKTTKRQWFYMPSDGEVTGNARNEWALLLGLLTADGAYTGNASSGGVNFTPYDDTILDSIKNILDAHKLQAVPLTTPGEYRISAVDQHRNIRKNDDGKWVRNELIELLKAEGMYGQHSYEKTLPASITEWDKYSIAEYIKGLVSCDGWVCKDGHVMGFSSSSARITYWVKYILEWVFGIYATRITEKNKKKSDGTFYRTMHEICICGKEMMAKFRDKIGLAGVKSVLLEAKTRGVTASDTVKFCMTDQVPAGKRDTWDLTVDNETHLFALANGLIVSNTQMSLRAKHGGGAYTGKMDFSGMDFLTQFVQSPKVYPHRAEVSQHAGEVTKIEEAPQGGTYIWVGEERHYAPHGYPPIVEVGDKVEPGDQLSDGLVDVKDIIATRGLGEGRLYFSKRLKQMMDDSGAETTQRNTEMLARAVIDHVEIDDPDGLGGFLPGDMASYNSVMQHYSPPPTVRLRSLSDANEVVGKYLHGNVGHFTAGTRLTPRMVNDMKEAGYDSAPLDDEPPAFRPEMERLRTATTANTNDWIANMAASYMKSNLLEGAMRGEEGRYRNSTHFAGPLAFGKGFAGDIRETGKF